MLLWAVLVPACDGSSESDGSTDWEWDENPEEWRCLEEGDMRCDGNVHEWCVADQEFLAVRSRDCAAEGLVCVQDPPLGCAECVPDSLGCDGQYIVECDPETATWETVGWCNPAMGEACVAGRCFNGCEYADELDSNVGCDYWAVDLDNAMVGFGLDASSQQFAVVVSNPSALDATVTVERNVAGPGEAPEVELVDEQLLFPGDLYTFLLDRREVDGSSLFGMDDGTHTALTTNAYHITSTAPIVAYQFNPLDNVDVFSNDASILIPKNSTGTRYLVLGWPQTIAETPEYPGTDMGNDLRAFLTIVGTEPVTTVVVTLPLVDGLEVLGDGDTIPRLYGGDTLTMELGMFEVLNLETDSFMADFTGTEVVADKPIAVFSGSEASDVPTFTTLSDRQCCADHLEQQVYPEGTQGRTFVAGLTPSRTEAVRAAGADVAVPEKGEKEYFRIMAVHDDTVVETTLDPPDDSFHLARGEHVTVMSTRDFLITSHKPISVGQYVASQNVTGISSDLPGGDPAFILMSPKEQWREAYIFLTPSLYAFDFVIIAHDVTTDIEMDGAPLPPTCRTRPVPGAETVAVTRCQLSFPEIVDGTPPDNVLDGEQDDGVHDITADAPIGLVVYGFDSYVSYGYPGGTDLQIIE
jgi:hypothetical protein